MRLAQTSTGIAPSRDLSPPITEESLAQLSFKDVAMIMAIGEMTAYQDERLAFAKLRQALSPAHDPAVNTVICNEPTSGSLGKPNTQSDFHPQSKDWFVVDSVVFPDNASPCLLTMAFVFQLLYRSNDEYRPPVLLYDSIRYREIGYIRQMVHWGNRLKCQLSLREKSPALQEPRWSKALRATPESGSDARGDFTLPVPTLLVIAPHAESTRTP